MNTRMLSDLACKVRARLSYPTAGSAANHRPAGVLLILCCAILPPLLLAASSTQAADNARRLHVITLKHTLAPDLLPQLRPLLPPQAGISAHENRLLLNVSDAELQQLQSLIDAIDQAPARILVEVRQLHGLAATDAGVRLDVQAASGDDSGNASVQADAQLRYRTHRDQDSTRQQVQGLSGQNVWIETGREIPSLTLTLDPHTGLMHGGTQYRRHGTGFYANARVLADDQVSVVINAGQRGLPGADGSNVQRAGGTQLQGRLGEWLTVAASTQSEQRLQTRRDDAWRVELRVTRLR